jgi:hypothetical protein
MTKQEMVNEEEDKKTHLDKARDYIKTFNFDKTAGKFLHAPDPVIDMHNQTKLIEVIPDTLHETTSSFQNFNDLVWSNLDFYFKTVGPMNHMKTFEEQNNHIGKLKSDIDKLIAVIKKATFEQKTKEHDNRWRADKIFRRYDSNMDLDIGEKSTIFNNWLNFTTLRMDNINKNVALVKGKLDALAAQNIEIESFFFDHWKKMFPPGEQVVTEQEIDEPEDDDDDEDKEPDYLKQIDEIFKEAADQEACSILWILVSP